MRKNKPYKIIKKPELQFSSYDEKSDVQQAPNLLDNIIKDTLIYGLHWKVVKRTTKVKKKK